MPSGIAHWAAPWDYRRQHISYISYIRLHQIPPGDCCLRYISCISCISHISYSVTTMTLRGLLSLADVTD